MNPELIRAINIFNSKHYKYNFDINTNNEIVMFYDKGSDSIVHCYLKVSSDDTVDKIVNILEDLRKDLT